jgi:hypothetical protein
MNSTINKFAFDQSADALIRESVAAIFIFFFVFLFFFFLLAAALALLLVCPF